MPQALTVAAVVVATTVALLVLRGLFCRKRKLPGKLRPRDTFEHEDPVKADDIEERKRDFSRIVATRQDIWILTAVNRKPGVSLLLDLPANAEHNLAYTKFKFWLQGELGNIPGAVDLGLTSRWPVLDRSINFISVSPGFEFMMRHQIPPMTFQAKYLLMISKTGQVRCAWYAFITDKPKPGSTSGPFVAKLVSEDLNADRGSRTYTVAHYTAKESPSTDMNKIIASHLPLIMKGIDSDVWDPFLKA